MANLATCIGYRMWIKSSNFNYFKKLEGEIVLVFNDLIYRRTFGIKRAIGRTDARDTIENISVPTILMIQYLASADRIRIFSQ